MTRRERIFNVLEAALVPQMLNVVDESHRHAGHAGSRPEGETHMRITVVSEAFAGKTKVERHQLIYRLLREELNGGLHALALSLRAPDEQARS